MLRVSFRWPVRVAYLLGVLLLSSVTMENSPGRLWAEEPAIPAEATGRILGKIVDASGLPIDGVEVTFHRHHKSRDGLWHRWDRTGVSVVSDPAGGYRFQAPPGGYFMVVKKRGFGQVLYWTGMKDDQEKHVDLVLKSAAEPVIQLTDASGRPVAGARLREFVQRGVNGQRFLEQIDFKTLGLTVPPSDERGRLQLPPLPAGEFVDLTIEHPQLAPIRLKNLAVADGVVAKATMGPGVTLTLRIPADHREERITSAVVDLQHEPYDHPSTTGRYEIDFDAEGVARLAVEPGRYPVLILRHDDFYLTPTFFSRLRIEPGQDVSLQFDVHRKAPAVGRIIDADTGRPLGKIVVIGEIASGESIVDHQRWSHAETTQTDADGRYSIRLAAGPARVSFRGNGRISDAEYRVFTVAADGSTVIPDVRLRSAPKVVGVVHNPDGSPAPGAVVRLRGWMRGLQPVVTDANGRFEIQPEEIPFDDKTGKRRFDQPIVAYDPYRPLATRSEVRLDQPVNIVLRLEPHEPDWLLSDFVDEMEDRERGIAAAGEKERLAALSLRGLIAPELDGAAWMNTDGKPLSLASLRGRYVLLDFWFTGCGPCHQDFPSVKLAHALFKDRGVVVIGVHLNLNPPEAVRTHVAKIGLPFPVMVDHPDGHTAAQYQSHGVATLCPSYVLIDPDGKVLLDDRTILAPTLRTYKLEIIRAHLLSAQQ